MIFYIRCLVLLSLLILTLPGCIGISLIYPKGDHESYRKSSGNITKEDSPSTVYWASSSYLHSIKKEYREQEIPEVIEEVSPGVFKYTYEPRLTWAGIIIHVLIPIPLFIPVGKERYSYTIDGPLLIEEESLWTENVFCGLGTRVAPMPIVLPYCDLGCWNLINRKIRLAGD